MACPPGELPVHDWVGGVGRKEMGSGQITLSLSLDLFPHLRPINLQGAVALSKLRCHVVEAFCGIASPLVCQPSFLSPETLLWVGCSLAYLVTSPKG